MGKLRPNFTQIPNVVLDEWMAELSKGELKVLLYVMRRTYGFQKESDNISISQICEGIGGKDLGTGLNRDTVNVAIASLEKMGLLKVNREGITNGYELVTSGGSRKIRLVGKSVQTSRKIRTELVGKSDTQNKEKERRKKEYADYDSLNKKLKFGELEKVLLTEDEHSKLVERFGERITNELIFELDTYVGSKGKKYSSHYATILSWAKRKADVQTEKKIKNNIAF